MPSLCYQIGFSLFIVLRYRSEAPTCHMPHSILFNLLKDSAVAATVVAMEETRVCRICLVTGVRMYGVNPLVSGPSLYRCYREITGICWSYEVRYICYECAWRLRAAQGLRERSLRAHGLLTSLASTGMLNAAGLAGVDRAWLQLVSPLSVQHTGGGVALFVHDESAAELKRELEGDLESEDGSAFIPAPDSPVPAGPLSAPDSKAWLLDVASIKVEEAHASDWERELLSPASEECSDDDTPIARMAGAGAGAAAAAAAAAAPIGEVKAKAKAKLAELLKDIRKEKAPKVKKCRAKTKEKTVPKKNKKKKKGTFTRSKTFDPTSYEQFARVVFMSRADALDEIRKRLDSSNYKLAAHRCDLCYRGFWQLAAYENHMIKHDPKSGEHECDVCRLRFESRRSLQHHQANFHRSKFYCKRCPHYCTNPPLARRHENWHNGIVYTCKQCNKNFARVSTLQSHVRRLHASQFACELCGLSFVGKRGIVAHKNRMHRDEKGKPPRLEGPHCSECDITFVSSEAWKRHLVVSPKHNLKETANGCEICGETFPSAEELRLHHRTHARKYPKQYLHKKKNNGIAWPVDCEQCKAKINSSVEYKLHFQKEHPDKNRTHFPVWRSSFMCETCGRVFRNQALLGYHQRKHTGERPFACDACPKSFASASHLAQHARMHTGQLPFECHLCGKRFNYKNNLERHCNIHTGIKPHKCEYCGKCFTQTAERKSHIDYVHLKKPWPKRDRSQRKQPYSAAAPSAPSAPAAPAAQRPYI